MIFFGGGILFYFVFHNKSNYLLCDISIFEDIYLCTSSRPCLWNCFKTIESCGVHEDGYVIPEFNHIFSKPITFHDGYCMVLCQHWPLNGDSCWSQNLSTYHLIKWWNASIVLLQWKGLPSLVDPRLGDFSSSPTIFLLSSM